jgi:hypothetical protein
MKRKKLVRVFGTCLAVLLLCHGAVLAAEKEPAVGHKAGNVAFSAPITAEDATYLGLAKPAPFSLKDVKADFVMVETMNTT